MSTIRRLPLVAACGLAGSALVLTSCSGGVQSGSDTAGGGESDSLTLIWKGSERAGLEAVMEQYAKDFPEVDVDFTFADVEQLQSTLRTQLSSGTAPDVLFVWPGNGNPGSIEQIAPGGYLEDLSGHDWAGQYPAGLEPLTQVEDKTYLMAPTVTAFGGWYNDQAMQAAGLTAPTTWPEVLAFCADAQAAGKVAYAMGAQTLNFTQNIPYSLVPTLVYGQEPDFDELLAAGETTFTDSPGWQDAMTKYQQLNDAGCFNEGATGTSTDQAVEIAARGDALATVAIGYTLSSLEAANAEATFSFAPLPATDDPADTLLAASSAGGAAVNAKAKNKDRALEFVDYLASPEIMNIYNSALRGAVPSISNDAFDADDSFSVITEYLDAGETVAFLDQNWPNARIQQALYSGSQALLAGQVGPEDVLADMDKEYETEE
ncbi:ABC transporter substrate-binding protein [Jiangella alba]|uniref:Carbohydrate ABC transporter substrate-binding protein, CUT1 family n=1 Tax=Jiangella alba TaxID=561176 RepID=A0A1H5MQB5_9ACTN|nr:ABC transporter substrate-binding protein [Jiangella alba]SEE90568.1 carbohydrate ABC transporter substrate-binding protein, CUT1 family [Jiangella alba]